MAEYSSSSKSSSSSSSSSGSNKIRDIVRLQQILKKWKKLANNNKNSNTGTGTGTTSSSSSRSIKFLKKTLSFSESSSSSNSSSSSAAGFLGGNNNNNNVPKGYMAVCVGKELKRFVIPTEYLKHQLFGILLREAEEEFGFQQEGVLKFPCEVDLFEKIIKMMEDDHNNKRPPMPRSNSSILLSMLHNHHHEFGLNLDHDSANCSPETTTDQLTPTPHHPQMCR